MRFAEILRTGDYGSKGSVVEAECRAFLRAGGTLSLADWDAMSSDGRLAFVAAGETFHVEQARLAAQETVAVTAEAMRLARERQAASAALDAAGREARR